MSSSNPARIHPIDRPIPKGKAEVFGMENKEENTIIIFVSINF
jgi:hypothetical protein